MKIELDTQAMSTGIPSVDRPWKKYYKDNDININNKRTVFEEVFTKNQDHQDDLALQFFMSNINYKEFFNKISQVSKSFREYGVKKGNFVTICAAGIPEIVYSFYALSKIGAIANMISPFFDYKDLVDRIEDCESDILIIMDEFYERLKPAIKKSRIKNVIVLPTLNSSILKYFSKKYKLDANSNELYWNQFIKDGKYQKESMSIKYEPNLPLAMVYSSGSTGASKGILLSNDSFQNSVHAYHKSGVELERGYKFYQIIPPWFSTGLSTSIHLPLSCGITVFMDPRFERDVFIKNIVKAKPNYTVAPTSMYEGFLDEKLIKNKDLSYFIYPFEGGEPLRKQMADQIEHVFSKHNSPVKLRVGYGQCECGATITTETANTDHSMNSVGIPLPGVTIGIFNESNEELSYYERGRILVNTPCSMIEYFKNEEATEKYFYVDKNGVKWNCTGDIGYIDDKGNLHVEGRETDFTMVDNQKIYNFDIENAIMSCKGIKMCEVCEGVTKGALTAHIIFEDEIMNNLRNPSDIIGNLKIIQASIFEQLGDEKKVPYIYKIRDNFPYAKSGKRDMQSIIKEEDGFICLEKYSKKYIKKLSR